MGYHWEEVAATGKTRGRVMPKKTSLPKLVLDLQGENIPSAKFMVAARSFFGFLDDVASEVDGGHKVEWSVSVESGSVILGARPFLYDPGAPVRKIIAIARAGLKQLEAKPTRPRGFNDSALKNAQQLATLVDGRTVTRASVSLRRAGARDMKPVHFQNTAAHVDAILEPSSSRDYGTLEGRLETISIHGSPHLTLCNLFDGSVRCNIEESRLDQAWAAMRAKRKVAVSGLITYQKSGSPNKIDVEEIVEFSATPATASDVFGILTRR